MDIVGKIIQVLPPQGGVSKTSGKEWKLQGYVLETLDQYPRKVQFEVFGEDRIAANPCAIDQVVTVSFDLESREFNGRWYTSVRAWKIAQGDTTQGTADAQAAPAAVANAEVPTANTAKFDAAAGADESGDLPF